jgi:hypothetical protein
MNFNELDNDIALERQIRLILSTFQNVTVTQDYYLFRCNICGDSKKSKYKRRGYILKTKHPYMYFCHNCFAKMSVVKWMKEYFPIHYKDYYRELVRTKEQNVKPLPKIKNPIVKKNNEEKGQTKFFIPIKEGITPLFVKAVLTCIDRRIPEEVWSKWFVSIGGIYNNRMIIPFYDDKNKIYNYQGRALYNEMTPKYLTRKGEHNCIYNYYLVNKNKPVICFEGIIDCLMVPNSIAICGANKDVDLSIFKEVYYLLDNDETGKQRSKTLLQQGKSVFIWKKFAKNFEYKVKDLNELCIKINKTFEFEELKPYFSNSLFDEVFFI